MNPPTDDEVALWTEAAEGDACCEMLKDLRHALGYDTWPPLGDRAYAWEAALGLVGRLRSEVTHYRNLKARADAGEVVILETSGVVE